MKVWKSSTSTSFTSFLSLHRHTFIIASISSFGPSSSLRHLPPCDRRPFEPLQITSPVSAEPRNPPSLSLSELVGNWTPDPSGRDLMWDSRRRCRRRHRRRQLFRDAGGSREALRDDRGERKKKKQFLSVEGISVRSVQRDLLGWPKCQRSRRKIPRWFRAAALFTLSFFYIAMVSCHHFGSLACFRPHERRSGSEVKVIL